jgi:long-subunit fatty acid transport protein
MFARVIGPLLAALLLGAPRATAQGAVFNRAGSGARAAGMANAFIAVSDDGTAASWNPAGLGQLRKPELSVVSTTGGQSVRAQGFRTRDDLSAFSTARSSYHSTYLDFASLAVPVTLWGKPVTFQGAWRRLYSIDSREVVSLTREPLAPEGPPPARIDSNRDDLGSVDLVSIAGAVKLTPRLALGASFNLWRGDWKENSSVSEVPLAGPGLPQFLSFSGTNRVRGNNLSLGLMLTYPRWSVGLLHQLALRSDYSTQTTVTRSDVPPLPPLGVDGTIRFPSAWGLGGAWRPAPRWTVALDLTWDNWRDAVLDTPVTGRISFFDGLPAERTATRNTLSVNAGAERLFTGEGFVIPLRFGAAWEPQGARSPYTLDPVNYVMLGAGTGYNTNSLKLDAAFQFRWARFRDGGNFGVGIIDPVLPDPVLPLAVGERDAREWRLKLSLILRVTDTEKLRRTLRKVFGGGS